MINLYIELQREKTIFDQGKGKDSQELNERDDDHMVRILVVKIVGLSRLKITIPDCCHRRCHEVKLVDVNVKEGLIGRSTATIQRNPAILTRAMKYIDTSGQVQ